jgi:hypothetical protein
MNNAIEIPGSVDQEQDRQKNRDRCHKPDHQVDQERAHPLAVLGQHHRDRNTLRGDDLAPRPPHAFEKQRRSFMDQGHRCARRPEKLK